MRGIVEVFTMPNYSDISTFLHIVNQSTFTRFKWFKLYIVHGEAWVYYDFLQIVKKYEKKLPMILDLHWRVASILPSLPWPTSPSGPQCALWSGSGTAWHAPGWGACGGKGSVSSPSDSRLLSCLKFGIKLSITRPVKIRVRIWIINILIANFYVSSN